MKEEGIERSLLTLTGLGDYFPLPWGNQLLRAGGEEAEGG